MGSNYLLRLIKGCVLYLACVSAGRQLTIILVVPPEEGIGYYKYNVEDLRKLFITHNVYNDDNIIMYAETKDARYCLFLRLLLATIDGRSVLLPQLSMINFIF